MKMVPERVYRMYLLLALMLAPLVLCETPDNENGTVKRGRVIKKIKRNRVTQLQQEKSAKLEPNPFTVREPSLRFLSPFSLFNLVEFPNDECSTDTGVFGTCYTQQECRRRKGTASGSCAGGFGVCCTFTTDCNTETAENGTYFSSPANILPVCSIMIVPQNQNICQVRLELEKLELSDPDVTGNCRADYLQVTGGVANSGQVPTICGRNTGQHLIYSAIPSFPARLSIVVNTQTTATVTRSWRIRILQFSCDSPSLAPVGCLQYYTGISGNATSFNWKLIDNTNGATFSTHLANLAYSVCVRRESGYCSIEWSTPSPYADQNSYFSLTGVEKVGPLVDVDVKNGDVDCRSDYVYIPLGWGGSDVTNIRYSRDRFCGQALGYCSQPGCSTKILGPIRSNITPFVLGVVTDQSEDLIGTGTGQTTPQDSKNRGFFLKYRQQPCS